MFFIGIISAIYNVMAPVTVLFKLFRRHNPRHDSAKNKAMIVYNSV